jgi:hypothetical protein
MPEPYEPARARQLGIVLWLVVAAGLVLVAYGVLGLVTGAAVGRVILVALLPALVLLTLASWSRGVLRDGDAGARRAITICGIATLLVGVLYSQVGPGILIAVVGILLLLLALLPGRDDASTEHRGPGR